MAVAPDRLLRLLDRMVFAYQEESEAEIARIQRLETGVLGLTLAVLVLEALFIFRPMVRRVGAERARLVAAEHHVRSVLDHGYDGIAIIDEAGLVEDANPALERLARRSRGEIIGRPFRELFGLSAPAAAARQSVWTEHGGRTQALDLAFTAMRAGGRERRLAFVRESPAEWQRHAKELERRFRALRWDNPPAPQAWTRDVQAARRKGYSIDPGHYIAGVTLVAVPVFGAAGAMTHTLVAAGVAEQLRGAKAEELAKSLQAELEQKLAARDWTACREICRRFGERFPGDPRATAMFQKVNQLEDGERRDQAKTQGLKTLEQFLAAGRKSEAELALKLLRNLNIEPAQLAALEARVRALP